MAVQWELVESMGVVLRRYIDYIILLIPTPIVSVLFFAAASLIVVHFINCFSFLLYIKCVLNLQNWRGLQPYSRNFVMLDKSK